MKKGQHFASTIWSGFVAGLLLLGSQTAHAHSATDRCYKESGDAAIAACTEAIRQKPRSAFLYYNRGVTWARRHECDKAIADYNEAIRLHSKDAVAYTSRGNAWIGKREYDKAIADYNEAIRLNPKSVSSYNGRGIAWIGKRDYDNAFADFNEVIRLDPKYALGYNGRGIVWENKGEYDKEIADYNDAIRLDPQLQKAKDNLNLALKIKEEQAARVAMQPQESSIPQHSAIVAASAGKRVALIVGNASYRHSAILKNPPQDAQLLASTLRNVGFESVTVKTDLTREGMIQALREFAPIADGADWSLIYFSGHGVSVGGENYLIPIDALLTTDRDVELEAINMSQVLNTVERAKRLRVVILDACRDNPLASQMRRTMATRSLSRGLARIEPEAGTLVAYAAKHGETALDGAGNNSPFLEALVKRLQQRPPLEIRRLFDFVRDDVLASTKKQQQPFKYDSLSASEDFFFVK